MNFLKWLFRLVKRIFYGFLILFFLICVIVSFFDDEKYNYDLNEITYEDSLKKGLIVIDDEDTLFINDENKKTDKEYVWRWRNPYNNKNESLKFAVASEDYSNSIRFREELEFVDSEQIYKDLWSNDVNALDNLINAFKEVSKKRKYNYFQTLEFVIGAIQSIPYTYVTNSYGKVCPCTIGETYFLDECRPRYDARGCCNDIEPFAVYSPVEFAVQKTGDCDTRTLFAYTVLTEMKYDVTIFNSDAEGHSILGVHTAKPIGEGFYLFADNGKKYYIWELTAIMQPGIYNYSSSENTWYSVVK